MYPALQRAFGGCREDGVTIHDVATAAVEHKGGGEPVDSGVAGEVGRHLGADFTGVRVHSDPLAQQATAAMGARAFAYGGDVFLGPGETGGDLGLMAHELTHVAQQGAAGTQAPQRAVTVGDAHSPAEHQAEQVAAELTGGKGQPAALVVDDGRPVGPGQMLKSRFFDQLRAQITDAADQELGPAGSAIGCPYIDQYFARYAGQPAAAGEALLRRFAPATQSARTAADMIPAVLLRVREGVRSWRETGVPPAELTAAGPATAAPAAGSARAQALRAPDGRETLASLEAELEPGVALDASTANRMSDALGSDVSSATIHAGPVAARKAAQFDAMAFAVGGHVVMGATAPAAGTIEGDALLAHELAHTAQQAGSASDAAARRRPIEDESASAEDHADATAAGAVAQLHGGSRGLGGLGRLASRLGGVMRTGLQLQRCRNDKLKDFSDPKRPEFDPSKLTDTQISDTDEYKELMNPGGAWQTKEHVTAAEAQLTCRLIVGALRSGTPVDFDSQARDYLTKARTRLDAEQKFQQLWAAHPHNHQADASQNTSSPDVLTNEGLSQDYDNTCAVRISTMLNATGNPITPAKAKAAGLERKPDYSPKTKKYYILTAKEMWQYLEKNFRNPDQMFPASGKYADRAAFQAAFSSTIKPVVGSRKGIVAFDKIFDFSGTGHVDLFDGEHLSNAASWYPCERLRLWFIVVP